MPGRIAVCSGPEQTGGHPLFGKVEKNSRAGCARRCEGWPSAWVRSAAGSAAWARTEAAAGRTTGGSVWR